MKLLTAAGNGNGAAVLKGQWGNREIDQFDTLFVWGVFDGATVKVEISPDGGTTWFDTGVAIVVKGVQNIEFRAHHIRGVVSGGGAGVVIEALLL